MFSLIVFIFFLSKNLHWKSRLNSSFLKKNLPKSSVWRENIYISFLSFVAGIWYQLSRVSLGKGFRSQKHTFLRVSYFVSPFEVHIVRELVWKVLLSAICSFTFEFWCHCEQFRLYFWRELENLIHCFLFLVKRNSIFEKATAPASNNTIVQTFTIRKKERQYLKLLGLS